MLNELQQELIEDNRKSYKEVYMHYHNLSDIDISDEELFYETKRIIDKRDMDNYDIVNYDMGYYFGVTKKKGISDSDKDYLLSMFTIIDNKDFGTSEGEQEADERVNKEFKKAINIINNL